MRITLALAAALAALPLFGAFAAEPDAQAAARTCGLPAHARLLQRTREAIAYSERLHAKGAPRSGIATVACAYRYGIPYRLNQRDDYYDDGFMRLDRRLLRLAGTLTASVQTPSCGACETTNQFVSLRTLRTGRVLRIAPRHFEADSQDEVDAVTGLVLKRNGSLAFIYRRSPFTSGPGLGPPSYQVYAETSRGEQILDSGPQIDPSSLTLSTDHRTIYWRDGAATRSAPLN